MYAPNGLRSNPPKIDVLNNKVFLVVYLKTETMKKIDVPKHKLGLLWGRLKAIF